MTLEQKREKAYEAKVGTWLPTETAKLYKIKDVAEGSSSRKVYPKHGEVNFRTMSVARAAQLVKNGFACLEEKNAESESSPAYSKMKKAELQEELTKRNIDFDEESTNPKLVELLIEDDNK